MTLTVGGREEAPVYRWICDGCGGEIEGGGGVGVDESVASLRSSAWRRGESQLPKIAAFQVLHDACGADRWGLVSFPVDQMRTGEDLVNWTAHMWRRDWFHHTDWPVLLRRAQASTSSRSGENRFFSRFRGQR